jgi:RHS repeat-associated protein
MACLPILPRHNAVVVTANPYRFTGREWDSELGIYFYRARYYDPEIGRFLSEDPLRFGADPNHYSYVGNAPWVFDDPLGLCKNCAVTVRCWYIERAELGRIGFQHCYAEVREADGKFRQLGGGPENGKLRVWGWQSDEKRSGVDLDPGHVVYWNRNQADCNTVNCLKAVAQQVDEAKYGYRYLIVNSNSALATMLSRCGLKDVLHYLPGGVTGATGSYNLRLPGDPPARPRR